MGMFYNKLVESAVEDAIQTPDDIGVDLDAIEKAIVGDDGCEAHREEIDDAMEGVVGDPLEEASHIMYESEYNFNQLMKAIGVAELNEAVAGRDFILEGGNMKTFLENAKQILVRMFTSVTKAFNTVMKKLTDAVSVDKHLLKRLNDIEYGYKNAEWEFKEVYDFDALARAYDTKVDAVSLAKKAVEAINAGQEAPSNVDIVNALVPGINASGDKPEAFMVKALEDKHFKTVTYSNAGTKPALDDVVNVLKNNGIADIKNKYAEIKAAYSAAIKSIEHLKKSNAALVDDKETRKGNDAVYVAAIKAMTFEKNCQNKLFAVTLRAAKARHHEAVQMCKQWAAMGSKLKGKSEDGKKPKVEPKAENALFKLDLI